MAASDDHRVILKCDLRADTVASDSRGAQFDQKSVDEGPQYYRVGDAVHRMEYWGSRGFLPMCTRSMSSCNLDVSESSISMKTVEYGVKVVSETRDTLTIDRVTGGLVEDWIFKIEGMGSLHTTTSSIRGTCKKV